MLRRSIRKIQEQKVRRAQRIRIKLNGTAERPRVSVFRSLKHLTIQAIDDHAGKTLAAVSDKEIKAKSDVAGAKALGAALAVKLNKLSISQVIFDKGRYAYHGKVKAVAEGLRAGGLSL